MASLQKKSVFYSEDIHIDTLYISFIMAGGIPSERETNYKSFFSENDQCTTVIYTHVQTLLGPRESAPILRTKPL